ncbi:hypothetical protein BC629DRAFT_1434827 [Irpex lacteus]|nr:hypothetical protein BC629DRAFT_1434827 [Irpex lacteus]
MYSTKLALFSLIALVAGATAFEVTAFLGTGCNGADLGTLEGGDGPGNSACEVVTNAQSVHIDLAVTDNCEVNLYDDTACTQPNQHFLPGPMDAGTCQTGLSFTAMRVECT